MAALPKERTEQLPKGAFMEQATAQVMRKHKRVPMAVPALYNDGGCLTGERETRLSRGTVRDFSDSGICLFTNTPLQKGENITVICKDIWSTEKSGIVLWCNTLDLRLFRVGVGLQ
jgi:hypothetical protein